MDSLFTQEELEIRQRARQIANEHVKPVAAALDASEGFPWDIMKILAENDFFRIYIDREYGGLGHGIVGLSLATEELSRACAGIALGLAGTALGVFPLLLAGNDEQKRKYLPDLAAGKILGAFANTEPEAGSDAGNIKTTAMKDGNTYVLNGTKIFITNGGQAQFNTVIALTNPAKGMRGASAFIVEAGTPGFSYGKKYEKLGIRGSATCELVFEDCRVPEENLLGKEGIGFLVAMRTFDKARPGVAAQAVGIAQGALDYAIDYARHTQRDGHSVASRQSVQAKLADMAANIEAARTLTYTAARLIDSGEKEISKYSAMTKLVSSAVAVDVASQAVSICGSHGVTMDSPAQKYLRDAKITEIYEGTSEIQRDVIAKHLIKEAASHK